MKISDADAPQHGSRTFNQLRNLDDNNPTASCMVQSVTVRSVIDTLDEVRFYRANEKPYGAFSNLYRRKLVFEGRLYPTSEHAYQAGKARKEAVREWLLSAPSPALVAMAAHGLYTWDVVPNWSQIKYDRMRCVLRAKFEQHADLMALLLSTGEARLVEVAIVDNAVNRLWGEVNGRGQNMLGVMLMELRTEFRESLERSTDLALADVRTTSIRSAGPHSTPPADA